MSPSSDLYILIVRLLCCVDHQTEPSTTNKDYVYVDLSGITSAALAADKEPDLIDIDELITQCLNIDPKSERSKEKTDGIVHNLVQSSQSTISVYWDVCKLNK